MPDSSTTEALAPDYREGYLGTHDGLKLYYRDYGDPLAPGTPVLCLAGLTRNSGDFARLAPRLAARRRVVTLDYRGRGRSDYDPDWRHYGPEACVWDVVQASFALGLHHFVVIGTSYGGLLGMGLAVFLPAALAGLVMNDTGPDLNDEGIERIMSYVGRDNPQPDWDAAARCIHETFPHLRLRNHEDRDRMIRGTFREGPDGQLHHDWDPKIAKAILNSPEARDLWPFFRALRALPLLVIRGADSDVLTAAGLERMARIKPDLAQLTVEGVGHTPSLEEPECRTAIDEFLAGIDRGRKHG